MIRYSKHCTAMVRVRHSSVLQGFDSGMTFVVKSFFRHAGPGIDIWIAHVRRWSSDARFFKKLHKKGFNVVDGVTEDIELGGKTRSLTCRNMLRKNEERRAELLEKGSIKILRLRRTMEI